MLKLVKRGIIGSIKIEMRTQYEPVSPLSLPSQGVLKHLVQKFNFFI